MKILAFAFFTALSLVCAKADIIANGDFRDGTAHWRGDAHSDGTSAGITIQLDPVKWTKVSQIFNTRENALDFSLSFQTSADCTLAAKPGEALKQMISVPGLAEMTGTVFEKPVNLNPNSWLLMVVDPSRGGMTYYRIKSQPGSSDVQTVKHTIPKLVAHEEKTIYLAFPPGQGTITLLDISLTATTVATTSTP